ncbi:MAG: mandelate racemase/muconate lactonizing enzyme family protein [Bacteroidetes bacterium]|nr:mandelate racemase/muconate lactonizing enzyme family protein [Bacteroidota bacterium]
MIRIVDVETSVYRYPLATPVQTSFGIMNDRPMIVTRLTSAEGITGWGEIWCNFPNVGAEHRARLVQHVLAPLLMSGQHENAEAGFDHLTRATWVLGLQTGEQGPLAQSIAGLEIALADIEGKLKNLPIWKLFGGTTNAVPAYASGINPTNPQATVERAIREGFDAFKLKIGFGSDRDLENLRSLRDLIGPDSDLMVDANQAWNIEQAHQMLVPLAAFNLQWLEEPIAADRPQEEWQRLRKMASMPLAAGENIYRQDQFDAVVDADILGVVQPDLAKWGGLSKTIPLARAIRASGTRYCPHYLGGGIGLVASAHALAAAGGDGMLEVDINPNPLRTEFAGELFSHQSDEKDNTGPKMAYLGDDAGLGYTPNLDALAEFKVQF